MTAQPYSDDLTTDDFVKYLNLYVGEMDWRPELNRLYAERRKGDSYTPQDIAELRQQLSFMVLLPAYNRRMDLDSPIGILRGWKKFDQHDKEDWYKKLKDIVRQDKDILETRKQAISYGIIYPIHYNPRARQAYNWLLEQATASGISQDVASKKMENLVLFYGGVVICNIFQKPEYEKFIKNILNWRTIYFFERLIYKIYKPEEILKIKQNDINEIKRNNPKLIKQVKNI